MVNILHTIRFFPTLLHHRNFRTMLQVNMDRFNRSLTQISTNTLIRTSTRHNITLRTLRSIRIMNSNNINITNTVRAMVPANPNRFTFQRRASVNIRRRFIINMKRNTRSQLLNQAQFNRRLRHLVTIANGGRFIRTFTTNDAISGRTITITLSTNCQTVRTGPLFREDHRQHSMNTKATLSRTPLQPIISQRRTVVLRGPRRRLRQGARRINRQRQPSHHTRQRSMVRSGPLTMAINLRMVVRHNINNGTLLLGITRNFFIRTRSITRRLPRPQQRRVTTLNRRTIRIITIMLRTTIQIISQGARFN